MEIYLEAKCIFLQIVLIEKRMVIGEEWLAPRMVIRRYIWEIITWTLFSHFYPKLVISLIKGSYSASKEAPFFINQVGEIFRKKLSFSIFFFLEILSTLFPFFRRKFQQMSQFATIREALASCVQTVFTQVNSNQLSAKVGGGESNDKNQTLLLLLFFFSHYSGSEFLSLTWFC